jgi:hypothetical protein
MRSLFQIASIAILLISCGKNNDSNVSKVVIKGRISTSALINSSRLKSTNSLSLSDTRKILVFNSSGGYSVFNVNDSSFAVSAASGTAIAISFLDADNKFIGCLHAGGLNVLPLVSLKNGDNTVIDLSTLTLEGTNVIPVNNPLGNQIGLRDDEIEWYKELGTFYESLSKNIDTDNDGIPDILVNKYIFIGTQYIVYVGKWGINDTLLPQLHDTSGFNIIYHIRISGGKALIPSSSKVGLSGPEDDPYTDILQGYYTTGPDCFISFFERHSDNGVISLPFKKGIYTLTLDGKNYTLNYSNVCPKHFLIMPEPTIHTNTKNEIVSVAIDYRLCDNSSVVAENFVYLVQMYLKDEKMNMLYNVGGLYESPETNPKTEKFNFNLPKPIQLSELYELDVNYQDLLGNEYDIVWKNE